MAYYGTNRKKIFQVVKVSDKTLIAKTITANGEYLPASDNADGYSKVTVNVTDFGDIGIVDLGTLTYYPNTGDWPTKSVFTRDLYGKVKDRKYIFSNNSVINPQGYREGLYIDDDGVMTVETYQAYDKNNLKPALSGIMLAYEKNTNSAKGISSFKNINSETNDFEDAQYTDNETDEPIEEAYTETDEPIESEE